MALAKKLNTLVGKTVQVDSFIETITGVLVSSQKGVLILHTIGFSDYDDGHDIFLQLDLIGAIRVI